MSKKKVKRSSGIKPFLYVAEDWHKDAPTQLLKTREGRNKMDNKLFIRQGNKTPEQLMIYLKNYNGKINKNVSLTALEKLPFLKRIVNKEAQIIISKVGANLKAIPK